MDFKQIQELIKMINKSNIGELVIEQKDFKISIRQKEEQLTQLITAAPHAQQLPDVSSPQPLTVPNSISNLPVEKHIADISSTTITIKSPMIGTFYRKASPDKPNYVEEGDLISPGKVICVIEAMKLFNEIESEVSGRIVKILAEDASPVEFDQPLFIIEP